MQKYALPTLLMMKHCNLKSLRLTSRLLVGTVTGRLVNADDPSHPMRSLD